MIGAFDGDQFFKDHQKYYTPKRTALLRKYRDEIKANMNSHRLSVLKEQIKIRAIDSLLDSRKKK